MVNGNGNHEHTEEAEAKQDGNGETDGGEESNEQEVIVIQDTGFTVKIQAPGTEPFDLQVRILPLTNRTSLGGVLRRSVSCVTSSVSGISPGNGPGDSSGVDGP